MIEKAAEEKVLKTANGNDGMERHGEIGCWESECCSKRVSSGCCPRCYEPELEEILNGNITDDDDILDSALEAALNSGLYNDGDTDEETYVYLSTDALKAFLDSDDSDYEILF